MKITMKNNGFDLTREANMARLFSFSKVLRAFVLVMFITVVGCSSDSTSDSTSGQPTDTVFPTDLAVASPTSGTTASSAPTFDGQSAKLSSAPSFERRYTAATVVINNLLSGGTPLPSVFTPSDFLLTETDAGCFGPKLAFSSHPDGTSTMTELPTGDLGIWTETDTSTGHACAAAQLTSRMDGMRGRLNMGLMGLAGMLRALYASGGTLPTAGNTTNVTMPAIPNVTFTTASIALDATAAIYTDRLTFTYTDSSSVLHNIDIILQHTPGTSKFSYSGLLTYAVTRQFTGGNCNSGGTGPVTVIGTLKYVRSSATSMQTTHRSGQFCGSGSTTTARYESDGQLDPTYRGTLPNPPTGWADTFSRFGAEYNPLTLAGSYLYGWQAGPNDSNVRILQLELNPPSGSETTAKDGESYYGFGGTIHTSNGDVTGFICNWAGPGNTHVLQPNAQRQFISFDSTSNLWTQPTGGSDIRYAPTNSCLAAYSTGFRYDRNLNGSLTDEVPTDIDVLAPTGLSTDLDLMSTTIGSTTYGTIQEAITTGRNYTKPSSGF